MVAVRTRDECNSNSKCQPIPKLPAHTAEYLPLCHLDWDGYVKCSIVGNFFSLTIPNELRKCLTRRAWRLSLARLNTIGARQFLRIAFGPRANLSRPFPFSLSGVLPRKLIKHRVALKHGMLMTVLSGRHLCSDIAHYRVTTSSTRRRAWNHSDNDPQCRNPSSRSETHDDATASISVLKKKADFRKRWPIFAWKFLLVYIMPPVDCSVPVVE
ncbi:hypothetical protein EDD85DRAFT_379184 [Armillaria nabsnona]|nr:hypothetical protein EDD85DRAFT_379184 [Armillaria nabsnona]